jgi:hypothetical protein
MRGELAERTLQHSLRQVIQPEFLEARRINDCRISIEREHAGECGCVLAGIERGRYFTRGELRIGNQQIDERGFAHARLADQDSRLGCQQRFQGGAGLFRHRAGRHFVDGITEVRV